MNRETVRTILADIGLSGGLRGDFKNSGHNIQFCCPFHGERRPSAGIHVEDLYGGCFACGEGFNLTKLVAFCKDFTKTDVLGNEKLDFVKASEWLEENYAISQDITLGSGEFEALDYLILDVAREAEERFTLRKSYIAPFQSGKMTHNYYYDRGFDDDDVVKFKMGWDKILHRITFPIFYDDMELAGVIGRVAYSEEDPKYKKFYNGVNSQKYYIYENAPIGEFLYPLWLFKAKEIPNKNKHSKRVRKRAILVEGFLDAQWMHKHGYPETLSTVVAKMAYDKKTGKCPQKDILLSLGITDVILMKDNDKAGIKGAERDYQLLKDDFKVYTVTYPKNASDPQGMTKAQIDKAINNAVLYELKDI